MIDFNSTNVFKLQKTKGFTTKSLIEPLMISREEFISEYKGMRDFIVFTNKRIIAVNIRGMTGKKRGFTSLPYSRIQAYSVSTGGILDFDSELELYFSALGKVIFEFSGINDIIKIGKLIGEHIL